MSMWLPASALGCYEGDPVLRSWLSTPGLLTERVRAATGAAFHLEVLAEDARHGEHRRAIVLGTRTAPWIYAETTIPDATLAQHAWLARMGEVSLGETLAAHGGVTRSGFAFARLTADVPLVARALGYCSGAAPALWVRRSEFSLQGALLTVQEAFLPGIGRAGLAAAAGPALSVRRGP
ncbi:MAG: chorismate lyase [Steroidobacteraceae bacterium]